jgi:serine/threonine protein kinase
MGTPRTPADRTLGKYELLRRLAVGGMAEIYLARAIGIQGFEKHVVLKKILPELARNEQFIKMFLDEARLAAKLQHQNIGQVYDIGQIDDRYFFTMEYLHGEDVRNIVNKAAVRPEKFPLGHALTIVAGAAAGLHYAHEKRAPDGKPLRIVHRDVSPSNLVVTYDGGVKLVDFGIARAATRTTQTRTGTLKGKIAYMSPEQCLAEDIDRRSDIFSLGIILYEITTMRRLFRRMEADGDYVVMDRIVRGDIPPPSRIAPNYPRQLEAIVLRCLQRKAADRYETAQDMLVDLEQFAAQQGTPLSTAALSRYVKELFGERPEPWHVDAFDDDDEDMPTVIDNSSARRQVAPVGQDSAEDQHDMLMDSELALPLPAPEPSVSGTPAPTPSTEHPRAAASAASAAPVPGVVPPSAVPSDSPKPGQEASLGSRVLPWLRGGTPDQRTANVNALTTGSIPLLTPSHGREWLIMAVAVLAVGIAVVTWHVLDTRSPAAAALPAAGPQPTTKVAPATEAPDPAGAAKAFARAPVPSRIGAASEPYPGAGAGTAAAEPSSEQPAGLRTAREAAGASGPKSAQAGPTLNQPTASTAATVAPTNRPAPKKPIRRRIKRVRKSDKTWDRDSPFLPSEGLLD